MSETNKSLRWIDFFISLAEAKPDDVKTKNIIKCLVEGADINQRFSNDCNNTPLHIAVNIGNIEIIKLLLQHGANTNCRNDNGDTPIDIAKDLDSDVGLAIVKLLEAFKVPEINEEAEETMVNDISTVNRNLVYQKRSGTSGITGKLYISKLLSLVLLRASLNKEFDEFYLGTGLPGMKVFYDVCMRYKKGEDEGAVFLQAIHMNEVKKNKISIQDLWKPDGDFSFFKCYHSFLTISRYFRYARADDVLFKTKTENFKYSLVIYTPSEIDFKDKMLLDMNPIDETARNLIASGDCSKIYKYKYNDDDIASLTKKSVERLLRIIGNTLADCICTGNYNDMFKIDCIRKYHVVLAHEILEVSEVKEGGYRIGKFRKEFLLVCFKDWCFLKFRVFYSLLKTIPKDKTKISQLIDNVCKDPKNVAAVNKLMQIIEIKYDLDNNTLFTPEKCFVDVVSKVFDVKLDFSTYREAQNLAVFEMLEQISIKLPPAFGNIDITVEDQENCENILACLTEELIHFIKLSSNANLNCAENTSPKNVSEKMSEDFYRVISSAIGNLLVLDEKGYLYKFNMNEQSLGKNAKTVLKSLKSRIDNLHDVKLKINHPYLPKLTIDSDDKEKEKARDFFNNLWFYTRQSNESKIEEDAKDAIKDYCIVNKHEVKQTTSNSRYDAIYYTIHDAVQKWWMTDEKSYYLESIRELTNRLIHKISGNSLLNVISCMFINRMKEYGITFNKDAVDWLTSQVRPEVTVLITEVNILTGIKLAQCFHNTDKYVFVDLNETDGTCYSRRDYHILRQDLTRNKEKTLIILYENTTVSKNNIFNRLTNKSVMNNFILVTNEKSAMKLKFYIERETVVTVTDMRNDLMYLDSVSQERVLDKIFKFQGEFVKFSRIISPESKILKQKILQKILKNEIIDIGKIFFNPYYEEVQHYYVHRKLSRIITPKQDTLKVPKSSPTVYYEESFKINTLESLKDTVVLVGVPGIGKSTYLTYLSIETKRLNPNIWIERINLLDQTKELYRLRDNEIKINKIDALKFVCKAALTRNLARFSINPTSIPNFDLEIKNDEIVLKNSDEMNYLVMFELDMIIHCYNQGNIILLFDGFDEICPHYKKEMTEILKNLVTTWSPDPETSVKQRMWITSRSYNNIKETLETEFGVAYNLKMFTDDEQREIIYKYLRKNLIISELNNEQIKNVDGYFEFMKKYFALNNESMNNNKLSTVFLQVLYINAMMHFVNETETPLSFDKKVYTNKWFSIQQLQGWDIFIYNIDISYSEYLNSTRLTSTPLHVYIALDYFVNQIKTVNTVEEEDIENKWNLNMNTSSLYTHFIETKLKKIRFEEKNQVDLNIPDNKMIVERELKHFMNKHKKLAFYASFREDAKEILNEEDVKEINDIIQGMVNGREKTGIVDSILSDGVPKFVHLSLQEYLAVEYMTYLLKTNKHEQMKCWRFILDKTSYGFLEFFDHKLEFDCELMNIITYKETKRMIYKKIKLNKDINGCLIYGDTILDRTKDLRLKQINKILLQAIADVVDINNYQEFILLISKFNILQSIIDFGWDENMKIILYCLKNLNAHILCKLDQRLIKTKPYYEMSVEEVITDIKTHWKDQTE